jgi:DNA-binding IclR family transcriptional regulator
VLEVLAALDHATAETLATRLALPLGLVERMLDELQDAGFIDGDLVH